MNLSMNILAARHTSLFFLGQAGFVLKSEKGTLLGIDMYLTNCVERIEGHVGYKRLLPVVLAPDEIIFDYVIATHTHYDHFDADAIPLLMGNRHTQLLASMNCRKEMDRLQLTDEGSRERTRYIKAGDAAHLKDIDVEFVFCDHGSSAPDAVGLVIVVDGKRIYVAGDTCLRLDKASELCEKGPYDYMIAPINGAYGNLNEEECVQLCEALEPEVTIPCHYGMFASHGGNPGVFRQYMEKAGRDYYLMCVGEQLVL